MKLRVLLALAIFLSTALALLGDDTGPVRIAPELVADPSSIGVGYCVPDRELKDLDGKTVKLSECMGSRRAAVVVARDTGCPLCKRYGPRLSRLAKEYEKDVAFVFLNCTEHNSIDAMKTEMKSYDFTGKYIVDRGGGSLGRLLGVRSTAEVFLIDRSRTIRYRGAVDDQYGIGYARKSAKETLLKDAIDSLLRDEPIAISATTAPGCIMDLGPGHLDLEAPTYHNRVSRIIQRSCLGCHREGTAGHPRLETFTQVKGSRAMIRQVVELGIMPPWFAESGSGPWRRSYPFDERDRKDLVRWIEAGAPEGNVKDEPVALESRGPWELGKPDLVVQKQRPFPVPAEGVIDYQYTYIKNPVKEDRWVQGIEILPSAPEVVHHVLVFVEEPKRKGESDADYEKRVQTGLTGYFGAMVPGMGSTRFAKGHAKLLPAGAWLKIQTHYTTNGTAQENNIRIGLHFAEKSPTHTVLTASAFNDKFQVPAGASNHEVKASHTFEDQAVLLSFMPHMHLRGKAFRYELVYPDGKRNVVLDIPRYDFNWQLRYALAKPISVPRGTRLEATAWFDNSAGNPANPDPEKPVGFGLQTWDEMMIGYFDWYRNES